MAKNKLMRSNFNYHLLVILIPRTLGSNYEKALATSSIQFRATIPNSLMPMDRSAYIVNWRIAEWSAPNWIINTLPSDKGLRKCLDVPEYSKAERSRLAIISRLWYSSKGINIQLIKRSMNSAFKTLFLYNQDHTLYS